MLCSMWNMDTIIRSIHLIRGKRECIHRIDAQKFKSIRLDELIYEYFQLISAKMHRISQRKSHFFLRMLFANESWNFFFFWIFKQKPRNCMPQYIFQFAPRLWLTGAIQALLILISFGSLFFSVHIDGWMWG